MYNLKHIHTKVDRKKWTTAIIMSAFIHVLLYTTLFATYIRSYRSIAFKDTEGFRLYLQYSGLLCDEGIEYFSLYYTLRIKIQGLLRSLIES
jgi:hypothetical protein